MFFKYYRNIALWLLVFAKSSAFYISSHTLLTQKQLLHRAFVPWIFPWCLEHCNTEGIFLEYCVSAGTSSAYIFRSRLDVYHFLIFVFSHLYWSFPPSLRHCSDVSFKSHAGQDVADHAEMPSRCPLLITLKTWLFQNCSP